MPLIEGVSKETASAATKTLVDEFAEKIVPVLTAALEKLPAEIVDALDGLTITFSRKPTA